MAKTKVNRSRKETYPTVSTESGSQEYLYYSEHVENTEP